MYICKEHGKLQNEWCNMCKTVCKCDHSERDVRRFKDLRIYCEDGERTFTIYVEYCITCGEILEIKR